MNRARKSCLLTLVAAILLQSITPSVAQADWPRWNWWKNHHSFRGNPPATQTDAAVEELARNIDWLEGELDKWGTVVAKAPDVWGEARLTQFRHEVEQELAKHVSKFEPGQINAAEYIADQAYLAVALAMQFGTPGGTNVPQPSVSIGINSDQTTANGVSVGQDGVKANINIRTESDGNLFGIEQGKLTIGSGLVLEQVQQLDQLKRYMDHLNELRRINEGDDNSDAPGYSLNLIRIPVSVLPGANSRKGCGAEITITAQPVYSDELLPNAFRDFVLNDLIDQLALPLVRFMNDDPTFARNILHSYSGLLRAEKELTDLRTELIRDGELCVGDPESLTDIAEELRAALRATKNRLIDPATLCLNSTFLTFATEDELKREASGLLAFLEKRRREEEFPTSEKSRDFREAFSVILRTQTHSPVADVLSADDEIRIDLLPAEAQRAFQGVRGYYTPGKRPPLGKEVTTESEERKSEEDKNGFQLVASRRDLTEIYRSLSLVDRAESLLEKVRDLEDILRTREEQKLRMQAALESIAVPTSSTRRSILPYPPSQLQTILGLRRSDISPLPRSRPIETMSSTVRSCISRIFRDSCGKSCRPGMSCCRSSRCGICGSLSPPANGFCTTRFVGATSRRFVVCARGFSVTLGHTRKHP
jgi:hypothetical protein